MVDFYNTNAETGDELQASREKGRSQRDKILAFFLRHPRTAWPPHGIRSVVFLNRIPLTSVRRALTDLTILGHLVKTDIRVKGSFGKKVYTWQLKQKDTQPCLF